MNSQFVIPFAAAFRLASSIAEASMSTPMTCLAPPPCPYVFHAAGQAESDGSGTAADVQQQRVVPQRQPVADVLVEHLRDGCVDLEEGVRRHAEGEVEEFLLDERLACR